MIPTNNESEPTDNAWHPPGRVLFLIGALAAGGAERAAVDLAIAMKRSGVDVELVCTAARRDRVGTYWADLLDREQVPIHACPDGKSKPGAARWLAGLLSQPSVSVVHIHVEYAIAIYAISKIFHKKRYAILQKITNMEPPSQRSVRFLMRAAAIRTSVAAGKSTYEKYCQLLKGTVTYVQNGMNFHWPTYNLDDLDERRRELGLDTTRRHVLHVGRISGQSPEQAQKAHDTLLKAWEACNAQSLGMQLHLIGDGNLRSTLEQTAKENPSISFHGLVPGVERWLLACDAFVLPSRWEGLPNAGIEAAGTGIPCIFSDIPPCREVNATRAAFHPVDDVKQLANLLAEVAAPGYRQPIDSDGVKALRKRFGIDKTLKSYLDIYRELIDKDSAAAVHQPDHRSQEAKR